MPGPIGLAALPFLLKGGAGAVAGGLGKAQGFMGKLDPLLKMFGANRNQGQANVNGQSITPVQMMPIPQSRGFMGGFGGY